LLLTLLALGGCRERVQCDAPGQVVARAGDDALTCGDTDLLVGWMELVAGRTAQQQRSKMRAAVRDRYRADPVETRAWLERVRRRHDALVGQTGFDGAAARAAAVYDFEKGRGPVRPDDGAVRRLMDSVTAVWSTHDGDGLALTESDIEAWILYGSLCREVQGGGVLRISVADRVSVYSMALDRWRNGSRTDRIALASLGPVWSQVRDRWQVADFETQQAWIQSAPLPPPMTASSLGYLDAILSGDLIGHAATLHGQLGPFALER